MAFGFVRIVGELADWRPMSSSLRPRYRRMMGTVQAKRGFSLDRTPALPEGVIKVLGRPMEGPNLPRFLGEIAPD